VPLRKVVDETVHVRYRLGKGLLREEVWQDSTGKVVLYNLAFLNPWLCRRDNGRVLGYDNRHGGHHRHHAGTQQAYRFTGYEKLIAQFLEEVRELREREEPL
jgi:hypothetical protein